MIYLLRHGQTEFNLDGRYQGQADSALTDLGRRQARAHGALLARHVGAAAIWASPLPRAQETARLLAEALPDAVSQVEDRLKEVSFGIWEGLTRADIDAGWPGVRKRHPPRHWKLHAPEGEGIEAVMARLDAVLQDAAAQPGDVVLVGHGVAGRLLRGRHAGLPLTEALRLDAPQDVVYRLHPGGRIDALPHADGR